MELDKSKPISLLSLVKHYLTLDGETTVAVCGGISQIDGQGQGRLEDRIRKRWNTRSLQKLSKREFINYPPSSIPNYPEGG